MIKVKESLSNNGISVSGNIPDILTYLERESERCPRISVLKYIKQRQLERSESFLFGQDVRGLDFK